MEFKTFETGGPEHREETLTLAKKNADELGIKKIVIASTTGGNISKALEIFDPKEYQLIVITHNYGFKSDIAQEFPDDLRKVVEEKGVKVISATLAFSGVQSALSAKYQIWDYSTMFARVTRDILGDGVKVVMECVLMACDGGAINIGEDVIAVAGTGRGCDTCALLKSAPSRSLTDLKVKIIFCKPKIARS